MLKLSKGLIGRNLPRRLLIQLRPSSQGTDPIPPQVPQGGTQELKEKLGILEKFDWKALSVAKFFSELSLTPPTKDKEERLQLSAERSILEKAIETDPLNSTAYKDAADFHIRMGEYEEALFLLHKALILNPTNPDAIKSHKYALQKAKIDPNGHLLHYNRGVAYFELGQYKHAEDCFKAAIHLEPAHKESLYNLMLTEDRLGIQPQKKVTAMDVGVTTHYEYAKLSLHVYYIDMPLISGWSILTTSSDIMDTDNISLSRDGFFAVLYVSHANQECVISHQGTDSLRDIITGFHHTLDQIDRQYICAEQFVKHVLTEIIMKEYPTYKLTLTGHSLGACQAEYLAVLMGHEAVTFESPGMTSILRRVGKDVFGIELDHDFAYSKITSYLSRPNLINIARPHIGKLIRVYPHIRTGSPFENRGTALLDKLLSLSYKFKLFTRLGLPGKLSEDAASFLELWETVILETLHWHSVGPISDALRMEYTHHVPCKSRAILRWPTIDSFSMYYRVTQDCPNTEPDESKLGNINLISLDRSSYEVVDLDPYILEPRACNAELIQFLVDWRNGNVPKAAYSRTDRRVLAGYKIVYDGAGNILHFHITCGLQAYQFKAYLHKRVLWLKQRFLPRLAKGTTTPEPTVGGSSEVSPSVLQTFL